MFATTSTSISPSLSFALLRGIAASTATSASKVSPACWLQRQAAKHFCARETIASSSTSPTLHPQARIMAQSDRNLVFHSGTKAYPPRQLRQQANVEDQDRAVHHLFQRHHGQALPLDLRRKASRRIA